MFFDKEAAVQFVKDRLSEPSTWRGLINLLTACGVVISPAHVEIVVAGGLALSGMIGVGSKDKQ